jgi:glycosyltransferase involved in cell wall biosynthesis
LLKVSIVIPVYNEESTLADLLRQVWNAPLPTGMERELIIVDNASSDGSYQIAERFVEGVDSASGDTARLLRCTARGKGNAVRTGFREVTGDIIMIQDGDLEYDVADYPSLLEPIVEGRTKFVLGSRHLSAGGWKIRQFESRPVRALALNIGGIFFHGLFNLLYGVRLTDPTTMYKVFRRECLNGLIFSAERFDFDYELLGKIIRSGHVPLEVPVSYRSRDFSEGKKIRVLIDPWTWVWAIVRFRVAKL